MAGTKDSPAFFIQGSCLRVWLSARVMEAINSAPIADKARVIRTMQAFANEQAAYLTLLSSTFATEGRFDIGEGNGTVMISAFKSNAVRVYGGVPPQSSDFVCTVFAEKKAKKARRPDLELAAKKLKGISQATLNAAVSTSERIK